MKLTRAKLENFWYYHKWHVIGGVFLLLTLLTGIYSCTLKRQADLHVLFAVDSSPNALMVEEVEKWLGALTDDLNKDGKRDAHVISTTASDMWDGEATEAMVVQTTSGKAVLYILTDGTYTILNNAGFLQELSGDSPYLEGNRYDLTASGAFDQLPGMVYEQENSENPPHYYFCIRKVEGTTFAKDSHYLEQQEAARAVLQRIIAMEAES